MQTAGVRCYVIIANSKLVVSMWHIWRRWILLSYSGWRTADLMLVCGQCVVYTDWCQTNDQGSIWSQGLTWLERSQTLNWLLNSMTFPTTFNFPTPADEISQIEPCEWRWFCQQLAAVLIHCQVSLSFFGRPQSCENGCECRCQPSHFWASIRELETSTWVVAYYLDEDHRRWSLFCGSGAAWSQRTGLESTCLEIDVFLLHATIVLAWIGARHWKL